MRCCSKTASPYIFAASVGAALIFAGVIAPAVASRRADAEHPIAVCATPTILNDLMESDRFKPEREQLAKDRASELEPIGKELEELGQKLQQIGQEDPQFAQLFPRFQELRQQLVKRQGEINKELQEFTAAQLVEAYKLVRSSAEAVADDMGFDYVISTGQEDEELTTTAIEATLRQIMARPVIMFPEGTDITADVREDLNLE